MRCLPPPGAARSGLLLPALLLLSACAMGAARDVEMARGSLVGLTRADLYVCAGFPSKSERIDVVREMITYELKGNQGSGLNMTLPVVGDLSFTGGSGYCHATF